MIPLSLFTSLSLLLVLWWNMIPCCSSFSLGPPFATRLGASSFSLTLSSFSFQLRLTEDDEEDDYIDTDSLGDWRNFRKSLTMTAEKPRSAVSKENQELLATQNQQLFQEYQSGAWAHETSTVSTIYNNNTYCSSSYYYHYWCGKKFVSSVFSCLWYPGCCFLLVCVWYSRKLVAW